MRLVARALLLLLLCPGPGAWAASASVRVLTWNLEWFPGRVPESTPEEEREHIRGVRSALKGLRPDVLILEEIKRTDAVEEAIQDLPGMKLQVASDFHERAQQLVLCSRYPVVRSGWSEWPHAVASAPRGFVFADLQVGSNVVLHVQGHHWKSNRGAEPANIALRTAAAVQLETLTEALLAHRYERVGCVIGGDFNTGLDDPKFVSDPSLRYLLGRGWYWPFVNLTPERRRTWQGWNPEPVTQFDHFLVRGAGHPRAFIGQTGRISDHRPVVITLKLDEIGRPAPAP